jgi:signal peptidase I
MRTTWAISWLLVVGVAAWWFILPVSLGGRTSLVVTQGTSMQPMLHAGDLVVVRRTDAGQLRKGDVVLYPAASIHRYVLHRIKSIDADGRLTMKGDNNSFLDPDHPTRASVIGIKAFMIPGAGKLPGAGSPAVAGIATALMLLLLVAGFTKGPRSGESNEGDRSTPAARTAHASRSTPVTRSATIAPSGPVPSALGRVKIINRTRLVAATIVGVAAAVGVSMLFLHARSIPTSGTTATSGSTAAAAQDYRHAGTFSYEGHEPNAAIQPDHRITTGEAAFTKSVRKLAVKFDYRVEGKDAAQASGTARLDLGIEDDNGWHITKRLDRVEVKGGVAHLRGTLDLHALRGKLRAFEKASGTIPPLYRLRLQPHVELDGSDPRPMAGASFAPELVMVMDSVRLRPETITGGDATKQYTPSAAIGDETAAAAAETAPGSTRKTTRPVIYGAAVLLLLLGIGITSALGAGSVVLRSGEARPREKADDRFDAMPAAVATPPAHRSPDAAVDATEGLGIEFEPLRPPAARRTPARRRDVMSVGDRLDREGIFYLPAAHTNLDSVPTHEVTEVEELTTLARMSNRAVIKHGRRGGNDWIVKTDHAHYVLREPGSTDGHEPMDSAADTDDDARPLGRAA